MSLQPNSTLANSCRRVQNSDKEVLSGLLTLEQYKIAMKKGLTKPYKGKQYVTVEEKYQAGYVFNLDSKRWVRIFILFYSFAQHLVFYDIVIVEW